MYGALTYYRDHLVNAPRVEAAKVYLVIGPWDHPGTRTPTDEDGGVKFGSAALLDLKDLHRQWYHWMMNNGPKPASSRSASPTIFSRQATPERTVNGDTPTRSRR